MDYMMRSEGTFALEHMIVNLSLNCNACRFDHTTVDIIFAEGVENDGLGDAIMNRLRKAAGNTVVREEETQPLVHSETSACKHDIESVDPPLCSNQTASKKQR